jgi:hypothetical protein
MSSYHYKPEQGAFDKRLINLAERIEAGVIDDSSATLLRSIWKISRLASDPRIVFCDAVRRVLSAERQDKQ